MHNTGVAPAEASVAPRSPVMLSEFQFSDDTYLRHVFYTHTEPGACTGWQHAVIKVSNKAQIFCPYSGIDFSVSMHHPFIETCKLPRIATVARMTEYLVAKWKNKLLDIPIFVSQIIEPTATTLQIAKVVPVQHTEYKKIKTNGKRGLFLACIIDYDYTIGIKQLCSKFSITRNNVLSYLYQMKKVNGIEYILNKSQDTVTIIMPDNEVFE